MASQEVSTFFALEETKIDFTEIIHFDRMQYFTDV